MKQAKHNLIIFRLNEYGEKPSKKACCGRSIYALFVAPDWIKSFEKPTSPVYCDIYHIYGEII
ncbi:hypothetical protein TUM17576_44670 [Enterobacter hormaechei]|nr:hypothetical protein TUM17576_44670 [Enterobacter hormaechei]